MAATHISSLPFGIGIDGTPVDRYTLDDGVGVEVAVLTHGATIQSIRVDGAEVTLGFASLDGYVAPGYLANNPYFGATVGRFANRIAGGRFTLDGTEHVVPAQEKGNALHGGVFGFDRRVWAATPVDSGVRMSLRSPDGDQGFPGTLDVSVTFTVHDGALHLDYAAAVSDRPTVLNLTNHTYFNLAGEGSGSAEGHELTIRGSRYLACRAEDSIPTGELVDVTGTPADFRHPRLIGERVREPHPALINGYDLCYELEGEGLREAAQLRDAGSGRTLTVLTTEPTVQLYSANYLDGSLRGHSGHQYRQGDGVCLETQRHPDAPNQPGFPSTRLEPGESWTSSTVFAFSRGWRTEPGSGTPEA